MAELDRGTTLAPMVHRRVTMANKTDEELAQDVLSELLWDTRIAENEVLVSVCHRIVTLTGTVDYFATKLAAAEAAHRVAGVLDVANDLTVLLPSHGERSDSEIALTVRKALEWDARVPDKQIQSTVSSGIVTLRGEVDAASARLDAETAIRNLVGVREVVNQIELRVPTVNPHDIEQAIRSALERRGEREAEQIEVEITGDSVTLTGTVHSAAERRAALGAACGTRGVSNVIDHLHVEH